MKYDASSQTVSWFRDQLQAGNLSLRPPYQRKSIWSARQKCFLVESMLLDVPIPEVFVQASTKVGVVSYNVVDGQQRIRAALQFVGVDPDPDEQEYNGFPLDKLKADSKWVNLKFTELSEEDQTRFIRYRLAVRELQTDSDDEVRGLFERLNRYQAPLTAQELRNAVYTGPFLRLSVRLANDEYWSENGLVTPAVIRRMGDVEFISELLIGVMHGPQGGSSRIIDDYYGQYEEYDDEFPGQNSTQKLYAESLALVRKLVPAIKGKRWGNRTDFYTLFVCIASLHRDHAFLSSKSRKVSKVLSSLASGVDARLGG